jgi:hypothetical protein
MPALQNSKVFEKGTDKEYNKGPIKGPVNSEVTMFKKTLNVTELKREINDLLGDLQGNDALQVVHRGKSIKVIITQERYFKLLGMIDQLSIKAMTEEDLVADTVASRKQWLKKKLEHSDDAEKQKSSVLDERRVSSP